jgi:hypothetical protein
MAPAGSDQGEQPADVSDDFCTNARDEGLFDIGPVEYDGDGAGFNGTLLVKATRGGKSDWDGYCSPRSIRPLGAGQNGWRRTPYTLSF